MEAVAEEQGLFGGQVGVGGVVAAPGGGEGGGDAGVAGGHLVQEFVVAEAGAQGEFTVDALGEGLPGQCAPGAAVLCGDGAGEAVGADEGGAAQPDPEQLAAPGQAQQQVPVADGGLVLRAADLAEQAVEEGVGDDVTGEGGGGGRMGLLSCQRLQRRGRGRAGVRRHRAVGSR
ncbi:hypothetical protein GCM10020000_63790 [Streptomyces olivoverticillatus]